VIRDQLPRSRKAATGDGQKTSAISASAFPEHGRSRFPVIRPAASFMAKGSIPHRPISGHLAVDRSLSGTSQKKVVLAARFSKGLVIKDRVAHPLRSGPKPPDPVAG